MIIKRAEITLSSFVLRRAVTFGKYGNKIDGGDPVMATVRPSCVLVPKTGNAPVTIRLDVCRRLQ